MAQGIQVQEFLHDAFGAFVVDAAPQENLTLGSKVFFGLLHDLGRSLLVLFVAIRHNFSLSHSCSFLFSYNLEISIYYRLSGAICKRFFRRLRHTTHHFLYLRHDFRFSQIPSRPGRPRSPRSRREGPVPPGTSRPRRL